MREGSLGQFSLASEKWTEQRRVTEGGDAGGAVD